MPPENITWDAAQKGIIDAQSSEYLWIESDPGTGKTAVACARVASLIDRGLRPSSILMVSFTRTAVAEIRDRIANYCKDRRRAQQVRVSTLDSQAWKLRAGFDDDPVPTIAKSYEAGIEETLELLKSRDEALLDFIGRFRHLVIDEAQDIVGVRAKFVEALIATLHEDCGVSVFLDSAQAIYGFTEEGRRDGAGPTANSAVQDLLSILSAGRRDFRSISLERNHRTTNKGLLSIIKTTKTLILDTSLTPQDRLQRVAAIVQTPQGETDTAALSDSTLILFRWRVDVLMESSFMSGRGEEHRIRMSGLPPLVKPWLGLIFGRILDRHVEEAAFRERWSENSASPFLSGLDPDAAWKLLANCASDEDGRRIDVARLRRLIGQSRPPIDLCERDFGYRGPVVGTIHASKGREADTVFLHVPVPRPDRDSDETDEEARVLYVGATRAKKSLKTTPGRILRANSLEERGRVFRVLDDCAAQVEMGRAGDVNPSGHLERKNSNAAMSALAQMYGQTHAVQLRVEKSETDGGFRTKLYTSLERQVVCVGTLSKQVASDLFQVGKSVQRFKNTCALRPPMKVDVGIYVAGVTTVTIPDADVNDDTDRPFSISRIALAPVIKGFAKFSFAPMRRE